MSIIEDIAVLRTIEIHPKQRVVTLNRRGGSDVSYVSSYGWPEGGTTALGTDGTSNQRVTVSLHQQGETYEPRVDDTITDADGNVWLILRVNTRLKFPTNSGYAAHDCDLIRVS